MKHWSWKRGWMLALAGVALLGVASCGDDGGGGAPQLASELFGTWDLVSIEAAEMIEPCPGEIVLSDEDAVSCGTEETTFNSDGTFVEIETTDEFGNPFDFRSEGTWSTQGSALTLTYRQEGEDENSLQPIDPPVTESAMWSVAGSTLTVSITSPFPPMVELIATLEKR